MRRPINLEKKFRLFGKWTIYTLRINFPIDVIELIGDNDLVIHRTTHVRGDVNARDEVRGMCDKI